MKKKTTKDLLTCVYDPFSAKMPRRQIEVEGFRCDNENWHRTRSCNFKNNAIVSFIVFTQTYFIIESDNYEIVLT
jgi:hypothetical protein